MDPNGDREGDFSVMSMTDWEAGTYEVRMPGGNILAIFYFNGVTSTFTKTSFGPYKMYACLCLKY